MSEYRNTIRLYAEGMEVGEDLTNLECPSCQVGHEKKFSISRVEGGILYNCYRGKCGFKGFIPDVGLWETRSDPTRPVNRPFTGDVFPLNEQETQFFMDTFGLDYLRVSADLRRTDHYGRFHYVLPIHGPYELWRGHQLRQPHWYGVEHIPHSEEYDPNYPKASTYKNKYTDPVISWAATKAQRSEILYGERMHVVLVEDYLSAMRVSCPEQRVVGVALNGTQLNYEGVKEIKKINPLAVSIWLDPGAEHAAYRILKEWGLTFNYTNVIVSEYMKDPKYHTDEELEEVLPQQLW